MKRLGILILLITFQGCVDKVTKQDLQLLSGYWEIEKVLMPDGAEKHYRANSTIEYFEFREMKGYRKKVQPRLDGTFSTSDDAEKFTVYQNDGSFYLQYKNAMSEWEERIAELSGNRLILVNQEDIAYHYKRFEKILP